MDELRKRELIVIVTTIMLLILTAIASCKSKSVIVDKADEMIAMRDSTHARHDSSAVSFSASEKQLNVESVKNMFDVEFVEQGGLLSIDSTGMKLSGVKSITGKKKLTVGAVKSQIKVLDSVTTAKSSSSFNHIKKNNTCVSEKKNDRGKYSLWSYVIVFAIIVLAILVLTYRTKKVLHSIKS